MKGTIEAETRNRVQKALAVRAVIAGMNAAEAPESPKLRRPGDIGSVLLPHELMGFNSLGQYVSESYYQQFDLPVSPDAPDSL